ncbi:serine/threonine-protein phosphatase PP1-like [Galendromus occidentalis]|uniref:Serine/threonine-protein phosphatase n=1 Tax=Galendromus occidentalis TaxID=34638 RepID=A0AAJ6QXM5_9ACAR|nr:serine/threonine-protein phosphatase PP1-like [Galendromus occidentalis]
MVIDPVVDAVITKLLAARNVSGQTDTRVDLGLPEIIEITNRVSQIFSAESMLLEISPPLRIFGDVHGQFNDLLKLLNGTGIPPESRYLFLGDYVDRGAHSIEVVLLLFAFKIKYPGDVFLLRGNHEVQPVNRRYGFFHEVTARYNVETYRRFGTVFSYMPVAAIVGGKIFCVHGGISPDLHSLDQIRNIPRPALVPKQGLLTDLLWADPDPRADGFAFNRERGVSIVFGPEEVKDFLRRFDMDLICRGHQMCAQGFQFFAGGKLMTLFSAPNYCGQFGNAAAVLSVQADLKCDVNVFVPLPRTLSCSESSVNDS